MSCLDDSPCHIKDLCPTDQDMKQKMKHILPWIILALGAALVILSAASPVFPSNLLSPASSTSVDAMLPSVERRFKLRMQRSLEEIVQEDVPSSSNTSQKGRGGKLYNSSDHKLRRMHSLRDLRELNKTLSAPLNKWRKDDGNASGTDVGGSSGSRRRLMNMHHYMSIRGGDSGDNSEDGVGVSVNDTAVHVTTVIPLGEISELLIDKELQAFMDEQEAKLDGCHSIYCVIVTTVSQSIHNITSLLANHVKFKANITQHEGEEDAP